MNKFRITDVNEYEMNDANKAGYSLVEIFYEDRECTYTETETIPVDSYNRATVKSIDKNIIKRIPKALFVLNSAAEVLYGDN